MCRSGSVEVVHVVASVPPRPSKALTSSVVQNKKTKNIAEHAPRVENICTDNTNNHVSLVSPIMWCDYDTDEEDAEKPRQLPHSEGMTSTRSSQPLVAPMVI